MRVRGLHRPFLGRFLTLALTVTVGLAGKPGVVRADSSVQTADPGVKVTTHPDGIDVYSTLPNDDGEGHYVHIDITPDKHYVFRYCRNALPMSMVDSGQYPAERDCYMTLGNPKGYTAGGIHAESKLMLAQAKAQNNSTFVSTAISTIVVFSAISLVEGLVSGGTGPAAMQVGRVGVQIGVGALKGALWKKLVIQGIKVAGSAVIGQLITSKLSMSSSQEVNDTPFATPSQLRYAGEELNQLVSGNCVILVDDNIHAFELSLTQILAKIQ